AAADPGNWWGLRDWTPGIAPVRDPELPLALSGSAVTAYENCPLAWFLEREAKAARQSSTAQGFGLVLHVLARLVATDALPAEIEPLLGRLDEVWDSLGFEAAWQRDRERNAAVEALERFLTWHRGREGREWLASEAGFEV